jgi:hypothetical protein
MDFELPHIGQSLRQGTAKYLITARFFQFRHGDGKTVNAPLRGADTVDVVAVKSVSDFDPDKSGAPDCNKNLIILLNSKNSRREFEKIFSILCGKGQRKKNCQQYQKSTLFHFP